MMRLNKVCRELNISLDRAIAILSELGYQVEPRPTAKIDKELHELLREKLNFIPPTIFDNNLITTPKFINEAREKHGGHPRSVYKYYSLTDKNFDSIVNKYLYYPKPSDFNDPFDCSKELISFINENSKNKIRHKNKEKFFSESLNNIGICCFSRTKDSILMWSHYASKHKGFCVEYKTDYDNYGINPLDINYVSKFKKAQYFEKAQRAIFHLIHTKSNEWKYEQELRASLMEVQTDEGRKISFRENEILSIYFGVNCEEKTIDKLKGIIEKNYSHNIIFHKGIMSKNDFIIDWLEH
jgi:hypothetical protein